MAVVAIILLQNCLDSQQITVKRLSWLLVKKKTFKTYTKFHNLTKLSSVQTTTY